MLVSWKVSLFIYLVKLLFYFCKIYLWIESLSLEFFPGKMCSANDSPSFSPLVKCNPMDGHWCTWTLFIQNKCLKKQTMTQIFVVAVCLAPNPRTCPLRTFWLAIQWRMGEKLRFGWLEMVKITQCLLVGKLRWPTTWILVVGGDEVPFFRGVMVVVMINYACFEGFVGVCFLIVP